MRRTAIEGLKRDIRPILRAAYGLSLDGYGRFPMVAKRMIAFKVQALAARRLLRDALHHLKRLLQDADCLALLVWRERCR